MLTDAFDLSEHRAAALVDLCMQKTRGNPFFLRQLLRLLYEEDSLRFDDSGGQWLYDPRDLVRQDISENVVDFLLQRIESLSTETVQLLRVAACIGGIFSENLLGRVCAQSESHVGSVLWTAVKEGLLERRPAQSPGETGDGVEYRFVHERIRQAAYSLTPASERTLLHTKIGKAMSTMYSAEEVETHIFEIVEQLSFEASSISDHAEKTAWAELFLKAGKRAARSIAFQKADRYFATAFGLLCDRPWESQYNTTLELFSSYAENCCCLGNYDEMERLIQEIVARATCLLEKIRGIEVRIQSHYARKHPVRAAEEGLDILAQLGCRFPKRPTKVNVITEFARIKWRTRRLDAESAARLPPMTDLGQLAVMRILTHTTLYVYRFSPMLMPLLVLRLVDRTLKYGVASESAFAFSTYGMILAGYFSDIPAATKMEQVSALLAEAPSGRKYQGRVAYLNATMIHHWRASLHDTFEPLIRAYPQMCRYGDTEYASFAEGQSLP